jgi:hypothetical protein
MRRRRMPTHPNMPKYGTSYWAFMRHRLIPLVLSVSLNNTSVVSAPSVLIKYVAAPVE